MKKIDDNLLLAITRNKSSEMQNSIKQKTLLRQITNYIRQKLELQVILTATVTELRSFLGVDRVKICKFNPDGSGQVIAESVNNNSLPSVLGLYFPGDEIPATVRELYIKARVRSIVNVDTQQIGISALRDLATGEMICEAICYRPVEPCHLEYLTGMGVKSSLVLPILYDDKLWGLLASHHSQPRGFSESEVELVQMVVEQLSIAIVQSMLLSQLPVQASQEATIEQIVTLLHSLSTIEFQSALAQTIRAFGGSGGRLCMLNEVFNSQNGTANSFADYLETGGNHIKVYVHGKQPVMPKLAKYQLMEQYSVWREHYQDENYDVWAISDVYQIHELRFLQVACKSSKIRGLLMIPLEYRQQLLGYLSIFRDEKETEIQWAGEFDTDERLLYPRQSFQAWQESRKTQAHEWTDEEIELAQAVGQQFAFAIHEHQLSQQLDRQTDDLQRITQQQQALLKLCTKMRQSIQFPKNHIDDRLSSYDD